MWRPGQAGMRQGRIFVSRTDLAGRRRQIQNGGSKSGRDGMGLSSYTCHSHFEGVAVFTIYRYHPLIIDSPLMLTSIFCWCCLLQLHRWLFNSFIMSYTQTHIDMYKYTEACSIFHHFSAWIFKNVSICQSNPAHVFLVIKYITYEVQTFYLLPCYCIPVPLCLEANSRDLMPGTFVQFQIFEDWKREWLVACRGNRCKLL